MKNDMNPQQKKEVQKDLKRELLRQGERHPRISLDEIDEMELKDTTGKWKFYAKVGKLSYYAWIDKETEEVLSVHVERRRSRKH